jgi:hypothetical protein
MSVDLFIQHSKRMDRIILSSVACLVLAYFSTSCINSHQFLEIKDY